MTSSPSDHGFPLRPRIQSGESLAGYCWRIYSENGHAIDQQIRHGLKAPVFDGEANDVLVAVLGQEDFARAWHEQRCILARWNEHAGPKWYSLSKRLKLCPHCVKEEGFHAFLWDLPLLQACPVHEQMLLDRCTGCGDRFGWKSLLAGWVCKCGCPVARCQSHGAARSEVQFAKLLAGAADLLMSDRMRASGYSGVLGAAEYSTAQVYEMLWWLQRVRRALTEKQPGPRYLAARFATSDAETAVPRRTDIRNLMRPLSDVGTKVQQVLRWRAKEKEDLLIDFGSDGLVIRTSDVLNAMKRSGNPAAAPVTAAISAALAERKADVAGMDHLLWNPRMTAERQRVAIRAFEGWWRMFASGLPSLLLEDRLDWIEPDSDLERSSSWLNLLNVLLAAANGSLPGGALGALQRRWHIPEWLREPSNALSEVGGYLRGLHQIELDFLLGLTRKPSVGLVRSQ